MAVIEFDGERYLVSLQTALGTKKTDYYSGDSLALALQWFESVCQIASGNKHPA